MKRILYIVAVFMFAAVGVAQGAAKSTQKGSDINLVLDLGDLSNVTLGELESRIEKLIVDRIPSVQLTCTITVKGSVNVGIAEFEIEVSVSGPCDEVAKSGKKLASNILGQVTSMLKSGIR